MFNHQEIALRLLDHPDIDVNKKTCESTALHYAALRNNVVLLEAICAKPEVQVNQKDYMNDGVTPLAIAVKNKHADAVRQLVKHPEVDLDPLDNDGHSLEFHVRRVENSRNAEILYIIEQAREARMLTSSDSNGGLLSWFGLPWLGDSAKKEEEEKEAKRRKELHEKELFELQALREQEEIKKRKLIEKSINDLLDSVERKREELVNKENVLKELKMIQAREKEQLEEEFQLRQRQLEETQNADAERITEERGKLRSELESLEAQLEELMSTKSRGEEEPALPCPECPVCLELLLPPIRIMQCTNGHLVCETCEAKEELTCCPTCRQVCVKVALLLKTDFLLAGVHWKSNSHGAAPCHLVHIVPNRNFRSYCGSAQCTHILLLCSNFKTNGSKYFSIFLLHIHNAHCTCSATQLIIILLPNLNSPQL